MVATSFSAERSSTTCSPGDDLVTDTFARAAHAGKFRAVRFDGFWAPMDTLKERAALEEMHRSGDRPWALWESSSRANSSTPAYADLAGANRFV